MKETVFVVLMEIFIVYWWLCLAYSRSKAAAEREVERVKYSAWDSAYKKALKADKGQYHAVAEAAKAVNAGPHVLKMWQDTYNKAVNAGVRTYTAGVRASDAARELAHKK